MPKPPASTERLRCHPRQHPMEQGRRRLHPRVPPRQRQHRHQPQRPRQWQRLVVISSRRREKKGKKRRCCSCCCKATSLLRQHPAAVPTHTLYPLSPAATAIAAATMRVLVMQIRRLHRQPPPTLFPFNTYWITRMQRARTTMTNHRPRHPRQRQPTAVAAATAAARI